MKYYSVIKKEQITVPCSNMNELQKQYAKWKKLEKNSVLYTSFIWNPNISGANLWWENR